MVGEADHQGIAQPVPVLTRRLDQRRDLIRRQILVAVAAVGGIRLAANSLLFDGPDATLALTAKYNLRCVRAGNFGAWRAVACREPVLKRR
jgi:hypothetical protein